MLTNPVATGGLQLYAERICDQLLIRMLLLLSSNMAAMTSAANDVAPVVQRLDNAIHRLNHCPVDKC